MHIATTAANKHKANKTHMATSITKAKEQARGSFP